MADERKHQVEIIVLPNRLQAKAGGKKGQQGAIDPAAIERAQLHLSRMSEAHQAQTRIDLTELQAAFMMATGDAERRKDHLRKVYKIADGILTLGKTFGYDLLSEFANSLNHFLVSLESPTPAQMQVVALHIDAMQAVVRENIKGDGGALGKAMSQSLAAARAKLGQKRTP
ncbi:MAG TPA: hypothetical protein VEB20_03585 [Azospirillaceae bacterium]|nr:hypothetical protein [Azospirillaceae bacterium]